MIKNKRLFVQLILLFGLYLSITNLMIIMWNQSNKNEDYMIIRKTSFSKKFKENKPDTSMYLIIAVDNRGSCPDNCTFAHPLVPNWIKFSYMDFYTEVDLERTLNAIPNSEKAHLFIVARTNIIKLSEFAVQRRQKYNTSIGLWHNADERAFTGEIYYPYRNFDYIIRNYWEFKVNFRVQFKMDLRALGNLTCGSSPDFPALPTYTPKEPRNDRLEPPYGVHWAMLGPHQVHPLLQHNATSVWPISLRRFNCSFIGREDARRLEYTRENMTTAMNKMKEESGDLNCTIEFTDSFAAGKSKWEYLIGLQNTKIGMCPGGSSVETHRLAEALQMGTVPALLDVPYLHAPFRTVPGIKGETWYDVTKEMKRLLTEEKKGSLELDRMGQDGAIFYEELEKCMKEDFGVIMKMILRDYGN